MIEELKDTQKLYNSRESHLADAIRYGTWPQQAVKKPTKWEKFKLKIKRILSYRIIIRSKWDSCDCEEW